MHEGFGAWYDTKQGDTGDLWHRSLIDPGLFARLGALPRGTRLLDLGCGNGYLARRLAAGGARVVGVDASEALVEAARTREREHPLGIVYHRASAEALPMLVEAQFDVAIANMSLMDIDPAAAALREVGRVLRRGGRFVFSISHPCFDIDRRSAYVHEVGPTGSTVYRKVTGYRHPHSDTYDWVLADGETARTVGHHRPLSWYFHELRAAEFVVLDLEEPAPTEEFVGRRIMKEWIEEVPLHPVVEARRESAPGSG